MPLSITHLGGFSRQTGPWVISEYGRVSTSAATITIPADVKAGDFAFLVDYARSGSIPTSVVPAGWTIAADMPGTATTRVNISYKILAASDSSVLITGMSGTDFVRKTMVVFRGNRKFRVVGQTVFQYLWTTGAVSPQTVTISPHVEPIIIVGCLTDTVGDGTQANFTFTPTAQVNIQNTNRLVTMYSLFSKSGTVSNHTVNSDDASGDGHCSGLFKLG